MVLVTEVYQIFSCNPSTRKEDDIIKLQIEEKEYILSSITLAECASSFKNIASFCAGQFGPEASFMGTEERKNEKNYSSLVTPVLNKLMGSSKGNFFAQVVIKIRDNDQRKADIPDHNLL